MVVGAALLFFVVVRGLVREGIQRREAFRQGLYTGGGSGLAPRCRLYPPLLAGLCWRWRPRAACILDVPVLVERHRRAALARPGRQCCGVRVDAGHCVVVCDR